MDNITSSTIGYGYVTSSITSSYIISELQAILDKSHQNPIKRKIVESNKSIDCACPICGDSQRNVSKKRFNIFKNTLHVECWNCGYSSSFLGFLKRFGVDIDPQRKIELLDYVEENIQRVKWYDDQFVTKSLNKMIKIDDLSNYFNNNPCSVLKNFKPVEKNSKVYNYLVNRKIFNHVDIYEATYIRTPTWSEPVLISINGDTSGRVLGIQFRNLNPDKKKRLYKIYSFSELYTMVYSSNDPTKELDEIETHGYNKLSYMYNILKINWTDTITIFEGFLDTKFFPNSIGCVGTNTDTSFILNQASSVRFFYDHDSAGIRKAIEYIKKGYSVFLWDRFFQKWSERSKNPYSAYRKLVSNIVDLNDVAKLINDPYSKLELEKHFAIDEMDLYLIKDIK